MTDHARRWSVPPVRMPSSIMRFSNLQEILSEKRSNHGCEAYRYSDGWRRRSGAEFRPGWERRTIVNLRDPGSRTRYVLPLNRENTRTIDRTGGTYLHSSRTN